jgi:uncharacterized protein YjbJ (UPF0337 family)
MKKKGGRRGEMTGRERRRVEGKAREREGTGRTSSTTMERRVNKKFAG